MAQKPPTRIRLKQRLSQDYQATVTHIAFNAWFWDQPYTGSGQYLRQLVPALLKIDSSLKITLIMPDRVKAPADIPPGADVIHARVPFGGQIGKVLFEQQSYPAVVG